MKGHWWCCVRLTKREHNEYEESSHLKSLFGADGEFVAESTVCCGQWPCVHGTETVQEPYFYMPAPVSFSALM